MTVSRFSFSLFALGAALLVPRPDAAAADSFVSPPSGTKLTFAAAFAEAMAQSPALRVIEADVESARGDVLTAQQKPASELTFSPGLRRLRDGDTANHEFLGSIELSRTFVFPGKRELLVSIAERNVALRQLATEGLRFQLTAAVRRAFAELLTAQGLVGLRQQQLESAQTFQQAAAKRAESGYASDFEAVKSQGDLPVPLHLRNAPTRLMKNMDYAKGYQYSHSYENNFSKQEYLPEALSGKTFYQPGKNAREEELRRYLKMLWGEKYGY